MTGLLVTTGKVSKSHSGVNNLSNAKKQHIMTGGVGFASNGRDSFKQNRTMVNRRGMQKDNPYSAEHKTDREPNTNFQELIDWKNAKNKKDRQVQVIIWTVLLTVIVLSILLIGN